MGYFSNTQWLMKFDSLKLNGTVLNKKQLLLLTSTMLKHSGLSSSEKSLYSFIKEWLSSSPTIKLKTSGSTGKPKTILVGKEQMIASAKMTCSYFKLTNKSNLLLCLSTEYVAGKMMVVRAFVSGANLITL